MGVNSHRLRRSSLSLRPAGPVELDVGLLRGDHAFLHGRIDQRQEGLNALGFIHYLDDDRTSRQDVWQNG